jgi:hypothetical protein
LIKRGEKMPIVVNGEGRIVGIVDEDGKKV